MTPRASTWRQLRTSLRELGALPVRVNGSHETWRFEDGLTFVVVRNHLNDAVPVGILAKFRRLRERRSAKLGEEPALLGRTGPRWSRSIRVMRKDESSWAKEPVAAARVAAAPRAAAEAAAPREAAA